MICRQPTVILFISIHDTGMCLLATLFQDIHIFQYILLHYFKIKHVLNREITQNLWQQNRFYSFNVLMRI